MEEVIKTFRLFSEDNIQVGTEHWILKDGHLEVRQKACEGFDPREWRVVSQVVKHSSKEEYVIQPGK